MNLAEMGQLATDLSGRVGALEGQVAALTGPADSIAVPNIYKIAVTGETVAANGQHGFALLEGTKAAANFSAPGTRTFELMRGENIVADTIGALETSGTILINGQRRGTRNVSNGEFAGTFAQAGVGLKGEAGEIYNHIDVYQVKGEPGAEITIEVTQIDGQVVPMDTLNIGRTVLNSKLELQEGVNRLANLHKYKVKLDGNGICYLILHPGDNGNPFGPPPFQPGGIFSKESGPPYPYTFSIEGAIANPFEFPQMLLPEGFAYLISHHWEFEAQNAAAAAGQGVASIDFTDQENPVSVTAGDNYSFATLPETKDGEIEGTPVVESVTQPEDKFAFAIDAFTFAIIPLHQPEAQALAGFSIKASDGPGAATGVDWTAQRVFIQQFGL
jgi:hypothetical protein